MSRFGSGARILIGDAQTDSDWLSNPQLMSATTEESARWDLVQRLFAEALECAPGERDAFLREACRDDEDVFADIASLLEAAGEADEYFSGLADRVGLTTQLEEGIARAKASSSSAHRIPLDVESVGARIGPYRVLSRIAYGGMGVVVKAERADGQFNQTVAIKDIPTSLSSSTVG